MRKFLAGLIVAICLSSSVLPAFADPQTITGDVVSLSCYYQNKKNIGKAGMLCANATVKYEGNPVGFVTEDGKVYQFAGGLVANNNAKSIPLLGHTVTITGNVYEEAGMAMISADDAKIVK